jgi:hypothetical protein
LSTHYCKNSVHSLNLLHVLGWMYRLIIENFPLAAFTTFVVILQHDDVSAFVSRNVGWL